MPFNRVMPKWKAGTLHSGGPGGPVVKDQKQAVAIMLSEKRKAAEGKTEYQPKSAAHAHVRRLARPSSFADGGTVQQTGMALVHEGEKIKPAPSNNSPIAMRNAAAWNAPGGGYDQHVAQDPERERNFPPGTPVRGEGAKPAPAPMSALKKLRPKY